METIEKTALISLHGQDYILKLLANGEALYIEIEKKDSGHRWKNQFAAHYIEELTQKTGSFKTHQVFAKMLASAISRDNDSVHLDILTLQDLELLKARKQNSTTNASQSTDKARTSNKRYIILTYVVEFDKVHYPLQLNFEENLDAESLKSTISRMQLEIEELKQKNSKAKGDTIFLTGTSLQTQDQQPELLSLKSENDLLREKCRKLEESLAGSHAKNRGVGAVEFDQILKTKLELEAELEAVKTDYVRDVNKLKVKLGQKEVELEERRSISSINNKGNNSITQTMNSRVEDSDNELSFSKKMVSRHQEEIERIAKEIENYKSQDRRQQGRIRQLEQELDTALRRSNYSRTSNRSSRDNSPYTRSRGASPSSVSSKRSSSVPNKVFSPSLRTQKPSPTIKDSRINTRNSPGTFVRGALRNRTGNSPQNSGGNIFNPSYGQTQKAVNKTVGYRKQSPNSRLYSPNGTALSGEDKYTFNKKNTANDSNSRAGNLFKTSPAHDRLSQPKNTVSNRVIGDQKQPNTLQQKNFAKLKEEVKRNIIGQRNDTKSGGNNFQKADQALNAKQDVETPNELDERLGKLQELLKMAKTNF